MSDSFLYSESKEKKSNNKEKDVFNKEHMKQMISAQHGSRMLTNIEVVHNQISHKTVYQFSRKLCIKCLEGHCPFIPCFQDLNLQIDMFIYTSSCFVTCIQPLCFRPNVQQALNFVSTNAYCFQAVNNSLSTDFDTNIFQHKSSVHSLRMNPL